MGPNLTVRLGEDGVKRMKQLANQANYQKPNQFVNSLIEQVSRIAGDQPFDVRDLVLKTKGGK